MTQTRDYLDVTRLNLESMTSMISYAEAFERVLQASHDS